jgi:hypothetical protein
MNWYRLPLACALALATLTAGCGNPEAGPVASDPAPASPSAPAAPASGDFESSASALSSVDAQWFAYKCWTPNVYDSFDKGCVNGARECSCLDNAWHYPCSAGNWHLAMPCGTTGN